MKPRFDARGPDAGAARAPAPARERLALHVAGVLVLKTLLLALLWFAFVDPYRVPVDAPVMSGHVAGGGAPILVPKDARDD